MLLYSSESSSQLSISYPAADIPAASVAAPYSLTLSNEKFLIGFPCTMFITVSYLSTTVFFPRLPDLCPKKNTMPNQYAHFYVPVIIVKPPMYLYFSVGNLELGG